MYINLDQIVVPSLGRKNSNPFFDFNEEIKAHESQAPEPELKSKVFEYEEVKVEEN